MKPDVKELVALEMIWRHWNPIETRKTYQMSPAHLKMHSEFDRQFNQLETSQKETRKEHEEIRQLISKKIQQNNR